MMPDQDELFDDARKAKLNYRRFDFRGKFAIGIHCEYPARCYWNYSTVIVAGKSHWSNVTVTVPHGCPMIQDAQP